MWFFHLGPTFVLPSVTYTKKINIPPPAKKKKENIRNILGQFLH